MKHLHNLKSYFLVCGVAPLLFAGCASLVEKTGRVLDGSALAEKKTAFFRAADMEITEVRNRAVGRAVIITLNDYPMMKLRGSEPDKNGMFFFTSLDYLWGNIHGWNEYRLDLSGVGNLVLNETTAELLILPEIEAVHISTGRIRRYDTRITGNEALTNLRGRRERILALTEWLNSREDASQSLSINDFERYWKPILFPEIVSKKKQPEGWRLEGDNFIKIEDIRWNTSYTERIFPEALQQVRNSGTLLRDWEEALSWVYMEYNWENIVDLLSRQTILQRRK